MTLVLWLLLGLVVIGAGTAVFWGSRRAELGATQLMQPRRTQPSKTPADFGITAETVYFLVDGIALVAWFFPPAAENGATLIYVHGFSGNRSSLLPQAAAMQQKGYGGLLLDLRNHGESGAGLTTWGYSEANDILAAYNYLLTRPEVDPARIGLVGKSMGGAAVVRAAAQLPNLAVLVLESTYSNFEENLPNIVSSIAHAPRILATPILSRMEAESGLPLTEISSVETVTTLNLPVLVIHGERDQLVPLEQGVGIFTAVNSPKSLYTVPNAGHLNIFTVDPDTFTEQMSSFLAEHIE